MEIYLDSGDFDSILRYRDNPRVAGFTTNPTLMRKAGISDYRAFAKKVLAEISDKPISFEVFADDFVEMERQAREIASWGKNVYVKIPITNTEAKSANELVRRLADSGVQQNVTAVMTLQQVLGASLALKGGPSSIISVFAGRIADTGRDPIPHMEAAREICAAADSKIQLLWASPREVLNIVQAEKAGCHLITVVPEVLAKMEGFGKDLGQFSLETVQMFRRDALAVGYVL